MNQDNNTLTTMNEENHPMSYVDILRETQQAEFPLLSEVTQSFVEDPSSLMNAITDEEGTVVPCPLPDTMTQCLPQMPLTSQRHPGKFPIVPCRSRGKRGIPAAKYNNGDSLWRVAIIIK